MSIGKLSHSVGDISRLANEIGPEVDRAILEIVVEAYRLLNSENIVKKNWCEDKITSVLCDCIQMIWKRTNLDYIIPKHQHPDFSTQKKRGRPPTIDFAFRRGFLEPSYFGFECKLVNYSPRLIREYVDNGMFRFISGKYAHNESVGGMVGYLIECKVSAVVKLINKEILKKMNASDCLKIDEPIKWFTDAYISKHTKIGCRSSITLHHLFFSLVIDT